MELYRKNKLYFKSDHLVYKCCYHVIFCPKYRKSILVGNISKRLKEMCIEISNAYDFKIEEIETDKNHIHMIINCNPRFGVMKCIQLIKSITAYKLFREFPYIKKNYL